VDWDKIGLVHSICIKEHSLVKWKELYRNIQMKAGVPLLTQLLIDIKVRWLLTYVSLNLHLPLRIGVGKNFWTSSLPQKFSEVLLEIFNQDASQ
jgi:hypothetical protein